MTGRRAAFMWVGGTTTAAVVGVLLVMFTGPPGAPWIPPAAVSAGWLAAVALSGERRWAPTAAMSGALNMWALFLVASQGVTPVTSVLAVVAVAVSVVHLLRMQQLRKRVTT